MNTDLAIPKNTSLAPAKTENFDDIAAASEYLKRLQLMATGADLVTDEKIKAGNYALISSSQSFKDLGKSVDVLVCAWCYKAMDISGDDIVSVYDPEDPEFKAIKERSKDKQSKNLCGIDFLMWLPTEKIFATLYLASTSARQLAPTLRTKILDNETKPGPATISGRLAKSKNYKWWVPTVDDCTTPFDMPEPENFLKTLNKFQNPPKNEVETVEEKTDRVT